MLFDELSNIEIWFLITILFIIRYGILAGLFFYIFYVWKKKSLYRFKIQNRFPLIYQIKQEIKYSIMTFIIYGSTIWIFLYWIENNKTKLYTDINDYGMAYFFISIILMVLLHDTYFYWTHRLIHYPKIFKHIHKTHHSFHSPTPWAAFAFHPIEAIISIGIIPIILFLIPYHQFSLLIFISFLTLYNIFIHLGFVIPGIRYFKYQNTTMDHDYHHHRSHCNYGLYFNFWDRLMGTYYPKGRMKYKNDILTSS